MVKAKELKVLRKKLDQLMKSNINPLDEILRLQQQTDVFSQLGACKDSNVTKNDTSIVSKMAAVKVSVPAIESFQIVSSTASLSDAVTKPSFLVHYYPSLKGHPLLLQQCLQLFTENMKELYEQSSWGYNITTKEEELLHPNARFIVILENEPQDQPVVAAFVHFRYCYDDDDDPSELVLYVYELQVRSICQKQGIGQFCMQLIEQIAKNANGSPTVMTSKSVTPNVRLSKIMLTVFKNNESAMQFYLQKLQYRIDPSSPSCYNTVTDYEILSKKTPL